MERAWSVEVRLMRVSSARLAPLASLLLALACSKGEPEGAAEALSPSASGPAAGAGGGGRAKVAPAPLTESQPYSSPTLGALHGTVHFTGQAPERNLLGAAQSGDCKHHPEVDQRRNDVVASEGRLAGVFVRLASGYDERAVPPLVDAAVTLDQKGCMYVPRVLALRVGQTLRVTNLDPTVHNVHSFPKGSRELNLNMGKGQAPLEYRFERAERPVKFKCDIHPWMGAAVFVEEHPWFAVSDEQGAFAIRDVPPGEYVVEAVHESLGRVSGRVTVQAGQSTGFTLTLAE